MKNKYEYLFLLNNKNKNILYRLIFLSLLTLAIISVLILSTFERHDRENLQKGIASEVIRFHVVANSDLREDQELKLIVKDYVIKNLEPLLKNTDSIGEARQILNDNLDLVEDLTMEAILDNGFQYTARVALENDYFPLKVYGDIALPPGEYESVNIKIGEAKGQNWWCMMFPPLCFMDSTYGIVPDSSKKQLRNVLSDEEYDEILIEDADKDLSRDYNEDKPISIDKPVKEVTESNNKATPKIKLKFKLFDFLNDIFNLD